jgi:hypothetical protein
MLREGSEGVKVSIADAAFAWKRASLWSAVTSPRTPKGPLWRVAVSLYFAVAGFPSYSFHLNS